MTRFTEAEQELLRYEAWLADHAQFTDYMGRRHTNGASPFSVAILRQEKGGEFAYLRAAYHPKHGWKPYPVAEWHSARPLEVRARDVDFSGIAGWTIRWGAAMKRPHYGYYMAGDIWADRPEGPEGDDEYEWKNWSNNLMLWAPVANPEVLAATRYKYCGWKHGLTPSLPHFIRLYQMDPKVELLAKAGLTDLLSPGKVKALAKDKRLLRFIAANKWAAGFNWPTLLWCARNNKTPEEARQREEMQTAEREYWYPVRHFFGVYKKELRRFDRKEARKFCIRNGIDRGCYTEYLRLFLRFRPQLDIRARTNFCPANFGRSLGVLKRMETMANKREAEERRKAQEEKMKRNAEALATFADELRKVLGKMKRTSLEGYGIVVPAKHDSFFSEGQAMHNCVGGGYYTEQMAARHKVIVFLHGKGLPPIDIDIDTKGWKVRQCYTKHNAAPPETATKVAERIARRLAKHYGNRVAAA